MKIKEKIDSIKRKCAKAKIGEALDDLVKLAEYTTDVELKNHIILGAYNYNKFRYKELLNIQYNESERNQAVLGILKLSDDLYQNLIFLGESEKSLLKNAPEIIFKDYFNDNTNNWFVHDEPTKKGEIENGSYTIECKKNTFSWSFEIYKYIDISKSYIIEVTLRYISGRKNNGFGITWGRRNSDFMNIFTISHTGFYLISQYQESVENKIIEWCKCSIINPELDNILKICNTEGWTEFYINNQLVNKIKELDFFGHQVGFHICQDIKVSASSIRIWN